MTLNSKIPDRLDLDRVPFVGRTLSEYVRFFDLDLQSLKSWKVLDCPAGPASFVAEAIKMGIYAVGCDPLFNTPLEELVKRCEKDIAYVTSGVSKVAHLYKWEYYTSIEAVIESRMGALRGFEQDYPAGVVEGRYIRATLPHLPFSDRSFNLVLSGHFLFISSDKLDYRFHLASVLELCRVSSVEVRIYPIQDLSAHPCEFINRLLEDLQKSGIVPEILSVPFEFLRGANQMLRLLLPHT